MIVWSSARLDIVSTISISQTRGEQRIGRPGDSGTTQSTELFGRGAELDQIQHALDDAAHGSGSLVLVRGEAGAGKSALVNVALESAAQNNIASITGRCFDLSTGRPLSLWRDLLDDYRRTQSNGVPAPQVFEREALRDRGEDREALFEVLRDFLFKLAEERPWILLLEDLHWADPLSVELLRTISRSLGNHRLLIVATCRETSQLDTPFAQVIPTLVRESPTRRIELRALQPADTKRLVSHRYALTDADATRLAHFLSERTDGNPLLIHEMLNTLELDGLIERDVGAWRVGDLHRARVPQLVQQLVSNRLLRVSEPSRRLIEFASVIGEVVPLELWQSAAAASAEELDQAVREGIDVNLLTESTAEPGLRFTHALIRDAIYEAVTLPRRRLWHEYIAGEMAARQVPDPDAIADHLQLAGRGDAAVEWLVRAARRALSLHANDAALQRVSAAIDLAEEWGVDLPLDAYQLRARGLEIQGAFDAARADYERAFDLATTSGDHRLAWQAALNLGTAWVERDYERAGQWFERALELAEELDNPQARASSLNWIGNWHINREQPQRATDLHQQALEVFEQLNDPAGTAETLDLLTMATCLAADLPSSARFCYRAIPLFEGLEDRRGLMMSLSSQPITGGTVETVTVVPAPYPTGDFIAAGERALRLANEIGWPAGQAVASIHLSLRLASTGEYRRAWELAHAGYGIATEIDHRQWRTSGSMVIGSMLIDLLSPEQAVSWLKPALTLARDVQSLYWERITLGLLATAAIDRDDLEEAHRLLDPIAAIAGEMNTLASRYAAYQLARLDLAEGRSEKSLERLEPLIASNRGASAAETPHLALLKAQTLASLGRPEEADSELEAAWHVAGRRGERPIQWRIAAARGDVALARGEPDRAEAAYSTAREIVEELAKQIAGEDLRNQFVEHASNQFLSEGARRQNQFGLSPREVEVLRLIAEGYRDREIADQLFISPRTVTNHVTSILQKMNVPSRAAAAAESVRRGII